MADPFGGVGLGAFYAAMNGIAWTGCELEPLFHVSGHRNFEKWIDKFWCACGWEDYLSTLRDWLTSKDEPKPVEDTPQVSMFDLIEPPQLDSAALWARLIELVQVQRVEAINRRAIEGQFCAGCGKVIAPYPVLLQGDSRFLSSILEQVGAVVSSPPYIDTIHKGQGGTGDTARIDKRNDWIANNGYGLVDGQLGSMPAGEFDSVISSPAYGSGEKGHPSLGSVNQDNWGNEGTNIAGRRGKDGKYGNSDSQLANLPDTGYDLAISSPPFADNPQGWDKLAGNKDGQARANPRHDGEKLYFTDYAKQDSDGNLGNLPPGDFDMTISSPSWAGNSGGQGDASRNAIDPGLFDRHQGGMKRGTGDGAEGNIDHMAEGDYDSVISSPPFENQSAWQEKGELFFEHPTQKNIHRKRTASVMANYGQTPNQLGNQSGVTFWAASKDILLETHKVLRKGGQPIPDDNDIDFCDC